MKIKALKLLILALLFTSCYDLQKPDKPENLISEDKMVDVLIELTLVASAKGINKRELENRGIVPDSFVYKKHNIDSLQFANSNNYYAYDIKTYTAIYTKVKDSLEQIRAFYKKEDSIQKAELKKKNLKETKPNRQKSRVQPPDSTNAKNNPLKKA